MPIPTSQNTETVYFDDSSLFNRNEEFYIVRGYYHAKEYGFPIYMHSHSFYEINIVTDGMGYHYVNDKTITAKTGSVFVIPPNIQHGYYTEDNDNFQIYHIILSQKFMNRYKTELESLEGYETLFKIEPILRSSQQQPTFLIMNKEELATFKPQFDELFALSNNRTANSVISAIGKTMYMISQFCTMIQKRHESIMQNQSSKYPDFNVLNIINVLGYITKNYQNKISIDELAKYFHMSRSTLIKQFETYTNQTINEYIMQTRLKIARDMLIVTEYPVSVIAQNCGFFDSSHFTKYFKKMEGVSPLEYRQINEEKRASFKEKIKF